IERQSLMGANDLALRCLDGPGTLVEKSAQEFPKRTFPDEADARAVRLVEDGQTCTTGALANSALLKLAQRHHRLSEVCSRNGMQEVALILSGVPRLMQLHTFGTVYQARVVASGKVGGAQPVNVLEGSPELDLLIAKHIGIGCASRALLAQEVLEDPGTVLGCEADPMQGDTQLMRNGPPVLEVLCSRTVAIIVLIPIAHEEPLDVPSLLLEQQGAHRGIHSARESDDDRSGSLGGHGRWGTRT